MPKVKSLLAVFIFWGSASAWAASLDIRILNTQGAAIAGARVEVQTLGPAKKLYSAATDEQGSVTFAADPPVEVRVTAPGFELLKQRLDSQSTEPVRLTLRPATVHTAVEVVVRDVPGLEVTTERTALEIDRSGARTVYDAIDKLVPSAYVTRRGVMGYGISSASGAVTIRGVGASPNTQVLVVIDGRPDYMGLMGHPIPDFYTLSDVESLTITEGPASVLYGNRAMGGVIEIKPHRPRQARQTELATSFGSYYTGQHRLSHGGLFHRGFYNLTGGIQHTSGERSNAAFRNQDGTGAVGYDFSPTWRGSLDGRFGHFTVEDPGTVAAPTAAHWYRVGRGGFNVNLDNVGQRTWGYARLFSSHGHHMIYDGFRSVDSATGGRVQQSFLVAPQLTVDVGTDLVQYGGRANNIVSPFDYGEHHLTEAAGFTRAQWTLGQRWRLNAGVRYDHNSLYGGLTVPEFGLTYRLADGYAVSAAAARGFRNPTIRELYLFPAPNPLLQPERMWNYQATFQAHPHKSLLTWVTGHYADLSNLIVTTGRYPNLQLQNTGAALNRGVEANARWQPIRRLAFGSGYAYLRSTNLAPYVPAHKVNYSMDFDAGHAIFSLTGMTVGRTWADVARTQPLREYTVVGLKCTKPLGKHMRASVMVDNLLNREYQVIAGYPMPGTNAMAGLDFRF